MDNEQKRFGYKIWFYDRNKDLTINYYDFPEFAPAGTASEAIGNLAKIMNRSIPLQQLLEEGCEAKLHRIELFEGDRRLFRVNNIDDPQSLANMPWFNVKENMLVAWRTMVFDDVNRELLDALVTTFPEQKQIFKGKFLEDALGL
jgi:hypothetical protein